MDRLAVVGGGLIGTACALRLQQAGAAVTLIDPGDERARASFGNAGQIAIEIIEPLSSWATLRSAARRHFINGGPLDFRLSGLGAWLPWGIHYLACCEATRFKAGCVALSGLQARALDAWRELLDDIGALGLLEVRGQYALTQKDVAEDPQTLAAGVNRQPLTAAQRKDVAALLTSSQPWHGHFIAGPAKLTCPAHTLRTIETAFVAAGGATVAASVTRIETTTSSVRLRLSDGTALETDSVLVAAGARSDRLLAPLGVTIPLVAERGYHLNFPEHDWPKDAVPTILEDHGVLLTVQETGLRITGFTEFSRSGARPDPRKWRRLRQLLDQYEVAVRGPGEPWCGERPTLPDFLPAMGRMRHHDRVFYAFGHQHIGVTLAATTAELMRDLIGGRGNPALSAFDISRFDFIAPPNLAHF